MQHNGKVELVIKILPLISRAWTLQTTLLLALRGWCLDEFCFQKSTNGGWEAPRGRWDASLSILLPVLVITPPPQAIHLHPSSGSSFQWQQLLTSAVLFIPRIGLIMVPQRLQQARVPSSEPLSSSMSPPSKFQVVIIPLLPNKLQSSERQLLPAITTSVTLPCSVNQSLMYRQYQSLKCSLLLHRNVN